MSTETIICLHPTLEVRGSVHEEGTETYKITLKDCLACSGCAITEDEITLLSRQDPTIVLSKLKEVNNFVVLVSTSSIANLAVVRNWTTEQAFAGIKKYFVSMGALNVYTDTDIQFVWRRLLCDLYNSENINKPFLISRCAGANVFYERKSKHAENLSQIKPYPNLFAIYQKKVLQCTEFVLYIGPCYDRKLESIRFEGEVDAVLTISEIANNIEPCEGEPIVFPEENDTAAVLKYLNPNVELETSVFKKMKTYKSGDIRGAVACGYSQNQILSKMIEQGKCEFDIIEVDFCQDGCQTGGGLIRGESAAKRRELVQQTINTHKLKETTEAWSDCAQDMYNALKDLDIKTEYKSKELEKRPEQDLDW